MARIQWICHGTFTLITMTVHAFPRFYLFILFRQSMSHGLNKNKNGAKCTMGSISWICPYTYYLVIMTVYAFTKVLFVYSQQANDDALFEQMWPQVYNGEHIVDLPWYISLGYHDFLCFQEGFICLFSQGYR